LMKLMNVLEVANVNFVRPAWLMAARTLHTIRTIVDSSGRPIFLDQFYNQSLGQSGSFATVPGGSYRGSLLGFPVFISNQIPVNLTKGTSTDTTEIYFVDMSECVIGQNQDV